MARLTLTLRTLLAYLDDTLEPAEARQLGEKVAESEPARELIERIKRVTRRRGLSVPVASGPDDHLADPNRVAEYLSDNLSPTEVTEFEEACLHSDVHLAEAAACHQILTLVLTEPVRVPPTANQRMYKLVEAPASVQHRKPGRTLPVGGLPEQALEGPDTDPGEAALLLGMRRYSRSEPGGNRMALGGAIGVLATLLCVAIYMSVPNSHTDQAITPADAGPVAQVTPTPVNSPKVELLPIPTKPFDTEPAKPVRTGNEVAIAPEPHAAPNSEVAKIPDVPAKPPQELEVKKEVAPPRADRIKIGRLETENVIVLARPEGGDWWRFTRDAEPDTFSNDAIVCLPGFKASLLLDTGVGLHLWGNVPEMVPDRLFEVRLRLHVPDKDVARGIGFDADFTLEAGRVYLTSRKAGGSRVRVRAGDEVWDVTLLDDKSEVMIQTIAEFIPGTPFVRNAQDKPQTVVLAVVTRGKASLRMPKSGQEFANITAPKVIGWDSISGKLGKLESLKPADATRFDRVILLPDAELGKLVQRALSDMVASLTDRDGIRLLLAEQLTAKYEPNKEFQVRFAVYDQAALLNGDPEAKGLKMLVERMGETERPFARIAADTALSNWIAQAPGNSTRLQGLFVTELNYSDENADLVIRLLRGYLPPGKPNPDDLDKLIGLLTSRSTVIRELTLWNLLTRVDPESVRTPGLVVDVGDNSGERYDRFLKAWRNRAEEIKKAPGPKPQ